MLARVNEQASTSSQNRQQSQLSDIRALARHTVPHRLSVPASSLNGKAENVLWPLHDLKRRRLARIRVVSHEIAYFLHVFEDWVAAGFYCELLQGANERVDTSVERK